jgi:flagellar hook-associated protein 2
MASMSVDGLVSGLDTTGLITALIQAEGAPKTALETRLQATKDAASAYRTINTRFDAVRTAAEAVVKPETWKSFRGTTSHAANASVTLGASPQAGSLTFAVVGLAANHSLVTDGTAYTSTSQDAGFGSSLQIRNKDGSARGAAIPIGGTGSLADVVTAINASDRKLTAAAVQVAPGKYQLQITAKDSGAANEFTVDGGSFGTATQAADAQLKIGTGPGAYDVYSATNTFDELMPGATITASKADRDTQITVGVVTDPDAIAAKVQTFVDAVNGALNSVKVYTSSTTGGATAVLKGDTALSSLASRVLNEVSFAVGNLGSPGWAGLELTKTGTVTFDKTDFLAALAKDPALVQKLFSGTPASTGADGAVGGGDDTPAVPGAIQRVLTVANAATDSTTGQLISLAKGRDDLAKDMQKRIDAWDLRLEKRKSTLMRQFSAMETALNSLKNQSTWLAGQMNSLPSYS